MKLLAFAEQREGKFRKAAFEVTQAARNVAGQLGAELVTLTIGHDLQSILPELGAYGATRVIVVDDPLLRHPSTTAYSAVIADVARREGAEIIFMAGSQMGKDLSPRIAAKLEAGLAADCIALSVEENEIIASRPVFAGKAMLTVRVTSPMKIFSLRPNVFTAVPKGGASVAVETAGVTLSDGDFAAKVTAVTVNTGRPDLTEAAVIVSGGRGMKGPEHFHLIESLADVVGAAVGASRAVVDAGWRPHDEQVGQTGKTVSPTLYFACGISGAVQHLAGMSSSKYIVAINKDKDAPIFQVADYGIVGDVLEVVPALTTELKRIVGT